MSYSYSVPSGSVEGFRERALAAVYAPDDQKAGAEQAASLAADIVDSGIVGEAGCTVRASISGHVHTGEGSALPTCSISVFQETPPLAAT